jgi:Zn-dependent peptidase ImmA (M78 family)
VLFSWLSVLPGPPANKINHLGGELLETDLVELEYLDLLDDRKLLDLARKYGVSTQALVNRLKNLGYIQD